MGTKRKFTGAFKAQVAVEALKERETLAELAKRFDVHPNMITRWKQEFLKRATTVFDKSVPDANAERETEQLYAKIGKLEMELDWLKKKSKLS
jgi:transposase-like protein